MTSRPNITLNILKSYHPIVSTLQEYLYQIMESPEVVLEPILGSECLQPCYNLLTKSYVCSRSEKVAGGIKRLRAVEPMIPMREVRLLKLFNFSPAILTIHYVA